MNESIITVCHKDADTSVIERVITLKQSAWPYPKDSQIKWIKENLRQEDIHVFLCDNGQDVSYLNLVQIQFQINDSHYDGYGIGNVCAKIKGQGYGNQLVKLTNDYLRIENKAGLLFCHEPLIRFYSGCNWILVPSEKCVRPKLYQGIYAMAYNIKEDIDSLIYNGKLF